METEATVRPASVLLVEDNEGDVVLTREALREARLHIALHEVGDGREALEYLRGTGRHAGATLPDLILLDLNMPRMDGRELLVEIKRDERLRSIPVVVLTSSAAETDILRSYDLQASCFITKPVDFDRFQEIVAQVSDFWFTLVRLPARTGDRSA